jgi:hypothetical protein
MLNAIVGMDLLQILIACLLHVPRGVKGKVFIMWEETWFESRMGLVEVLSAGVEGAHDVAPTDSGRTLQAGRNSLDVASVA